MLACSSSYSLGIDDGSGGDADLADGGREGAGPPYPGAAGPVTLHSEEVASPPREAGPRRRAKGGRASHGGRAPDAVYPSRLAVTTARGLRHGALLQAE